MMPAAGFLHRDVAVYTGPMPKVIMLLSCLLLVGGCFPKRYNPAKATKMYPAELGQSEVVEVQVSRSGSTMKVVNGTAIDFRDIKLWLNRRYMLEVDRIAPGETVRFDMGSFWDAWGGGPNPGGLLRWYLPTPVVLVQAQIDETSPLIGFLAIPDVDELDRN